MNSVCSLALAVVRMISQIGKLFYLVFDSFILYFHLSWSRNSRNLSWIGKVGLYHCLYFGLSCCWSCQQQSCLLFISLFNSILLFVCLVCSKVLCFGNAFHPFYFLALIYISALIHSFRRLEITFCVKMDLREYFGFEFFNFAILFWEIGSIYFLISY